MKLTESELKAIETVISMLTKKINREEGSVIDRDFIYRTREQLNVIRLLPVEL